MLSLFSGSPTPETFPYRALTLTVSHPDAENRDKSSRLELDSDLLVEALQYSDTGGIRRFVDWIYGLQERYHKRQHDEEGWSSSVGCGGQDLLFKVGNGGTKRPLTIDLLLDSMCIRHSRVSWTKAIQFSWNHPFMRTSSGAQAKAYVVEATQELNFDLLQGGDTNISLAQMSHYGSCY